jgi:hypothetical protein
MFRNSTLLHIFLVAIISIALLGCSNNKLASEADGDDYASQKKDNKFLAYTHSVSIETTEQQIQNQYQDTIKACTEATDYRCIILDTSLNTGDYTNGHIKLRVEPKGVRKIIQASTRKGEVTSRSTHVEDLAKPIIDNQKRRSMLETHRARLMELQKRHDNDVESLIKISSELSEIQAELEQAQGENAHLFERIELDLVNINFYVGRHKSFWRPISKSLKNFTGYLSKGISETIWAIGYFFPWFIVTIATLLFCRFIWRKTSRKNKLCPTRHFTGPANSAGQ